MSLYIPYVYAYSHIEQIRCDMMNAIENCYGLGKVSHIDLVLKMDQNSSHFYQAYVHFEFWNDTEVARKWQLELNSKPDQAQILYYYIGYEINSMRQYHWKVMKNLSKKYVSSERKLSLNIEEKQEIGIEPTIKPQKQMTNKDFSDLVNAPLKKQKKCICDSESLDSCAKKIDFTNIEELEQLLDHSDYDERAKNRLNYLSSTVITLNREKTALLAEIERLYCEIKIRDNRLSWYNLQLNKLDN